MADEIDVDHDFKALLLKIVKKQLHKLAEMNPQDNFDPKMILTLVDMATEYLAHKNQIY